MKWRSASSAGQFLPLNQTLTLDQVAEFRRTRRVKEGTGSSASVSAAFGPVGPIHPGNPGLIDISLKLRINLDLLNRYSSIGLSPWIRKPGKRNVALTRIHRM